MSKLTYPLSSKNASISSAVEATITTSVNQYEYNPEDLYLAYGLSLLFTACVVVYGMILVFKNGQSYTSTFSTILCSTRDQSLREGIDGHHRTGIDPLPKYIEELYLQYFAVADQKGDAGFRQVGKKK